MDENKGSWIIGLAVCAAAFFLARRFFPGVLKTVITIAGIALLVIVVIIVTIVVIAVKKPKDPKTAAKEEQAAILSKGRAHLMKLRQMAMRVHNADIRSLSNEICSAADKILKALKTQPENIQEVRQFFNYYLPTMGSILTKYVRVEESGVPMGEMTENTASCMKDIRVAMDKQYANLFEDDMLDLSVEMEALTIACKRDGLLADESLTFSGGDQPADLRL